MINMRTHFGNERVKLLGIPVDRITMDGALQWISEAASDRKPTQIVVVNANKLYLMSRHPQLFEIAARADLAIPEWSAVWAAKRLGLQPLHHVGGVTLCQAFLPFAAERGLRPYFLGASDDVVKTLAESLKQRFPSLSVAGFHNGFFGHNEEDSIISDIRRAKPDILFVAMGSPKQELWIDKHRERLQVPVSIGVGGTFDVLAGLKQDTPQWVRGTGFEWLYRLVQQPSAYTKRYAVTNTWFLWQVYKQWSRQHLSGPHTSRSS
jgi:N-acetylglucosaminyldiphosphoundecaprenol N-acetyl-beta-D-mannosaminyltransferase